LARDSPSKPYRKLVKPSREQLIGSVDASQFTADDPTEPDCVAATSILPLTHEPCSPACFHDVVDSSSTGWESHRAAVVKRQCLADRELRARSYPPAGKLPDDWLGLAPLASPETLSESSSLVSCGSSSAVGAGLGYQRIMSTILPPRMDPILQSPARSSNSRDCGLYLESANVVGDLATLSPCVENLPSPIAPHHHNPDIVPVPSSVSDRQSGGSSTIAVRGSSPDVVQETRSTGSMAAEHGSELLCDRCRRSCVECWHNSGCMTPTGISSSRERGMCACDDGTCVCGSMTRPDIVSTHDHSAAGKHDV